MRIFLKPLFSLLMISILVTACSFGNQYDPTPTPVITILPAEIAVLNIRTVVTQDGSRQTTAELSTSSIGKGNLEVIAPSEISVNQTHIVKLTIIPENILLGLTPTPITTPQTTIQQYIRATQQAIEMYPIMIAELKGSYFDVLPNIATQKIATSNSSIEWVWAITPRKVGNQVLLLSLSTPVAVGANREIISTMEITSLAIEVSVLPNSITTIIPIESPTVFLSSTATLESTLEPTVVIQPTISPTATQIPALERVNEQIIQSIGIIIVAIITLIGTAITAMISYLNNKNHKVEKSDTSTGNRKRRKAG